MDILNIENCTIRYQEQEAAVEHVSLSVGEQEIVSIVGESGSGKTTLIRAILGILPPGGTVTEGKILFQGKNILELDETSLQKLRGTEIAMIFQDVGASLDPIRIVESQYRESILAHRKMAKADCRSLEKEMLAKMHLTDPERVMVSYPFELSGGMKQRVGSQISPSFPTRSPRRRRLRTASTALRLFPSPSISKSSTRPCSSCIGNSSIPIPFRCAVSSGTIGRSPICPWTR